MEKLADRVNRLMMTKGLKNTDLADKIGLSDTAISRLRRGMIDKPRYIRELAQALGTTVEYLYFGVEGNVSEWDDETPLSDDEVRVPLYKEIQLSAGNGSRPDGNGERNGAKLTFARSFFKRYGVEASAVYCCSVSGDSMYPTLQNGSTVAINTADKKIKDNSIYAIGIDNNELLQIKRLIRLNAGQVRIISDNKEVYPEVVMPLQEINIIGRVFWQASILD